MSLRAGVPRRYAVDFHGNAADGIVLNEAANIATPGRLRGQTHPKGPARVR
ncbi:hypothetical protein AM571_PC00891 (plasmid) [Rhizobium etli 8C-3]|uniref:Uncharacterized protein n=1 Tax=Rhizobium etli 8C-3 TaxID=538025 RepID=A0A1L5PEM5_RHIET|nr:hypothetical protein AM571_PC00891 [Rhizobium etli 8C-3]